MLFDSARVILGLVFLVFGLNAFFNWWPLPKMNPAMMKFNEALLAAQIIMPVVKIFEVVFGLALLLNKFTFLATLALMPVCFFIILAHLCFNRPKGLAMAAAFALLMGILIEGHWPQFLALF